eukprot:3492929-Amphidinium_carterae.1
MNRWEACKVVEPTMQMSSYAASSASQVGKRVQSCETSFLGKPPHKRDENIAYQYRSGHNA